MNSDRFTRQAIRLAQRESQKRGHVLTREEVLHLSVQTVDPWKRVVFIILGLAVFGFGWFCHFVGAPWWLWAPFGIGGVVFVVIGLIGKKEYLDRELQKMHKDGPTRIADAIFNSLI